MVAIDRKAHWEHVYSTKGETGVSWYQTAARLSLDLICSVAPARGGRIIDVGGGASVLVDSLLDLPFEKIAVLDISETALNIAKVAARRACRLGRLDYNRHHRSPNPRYVRCLARPGRVSLPDRCGGPKELCQAGPANGPAGGHLVIASFADDGPNQCSDLDVCRYNAESMATELGEGFSLVRQARETHTTPSGSSQAFFYGVFRLT